MDITKEQLEKAAKCETVEEFMELAKAEGFDITEEQAKLFFAATRTDMKELSDDELDNVAGGAFKKNGSWYSSDYHHYLITTWGNTCSLYEEKTVGLGRTCFTCIHRNNFEHNPAVTYCSRRTAENDPIKKK